MESLDEPEMESPRQRDLLTIQHEMNSKIVLEVSADASSVDLDAPPA